MSNDIIPFGKYKGQSLDFIAQRDPQYLQWLIKQDWMQEKPIYQVIINQFSSTDEETPEHNRLQAKFLKKGNCLLLANHLLNITAEQIEDMKFEYGSWDVTFFAGTPYTYWKEKYGFSRVAEDWAGDKEELTGWKGSRFWIECKPTIGDEYPSVLRTLQQRMKLLGQYDDSFIILYCERFTASSITEEELKAMFDLSRIKVVFSQEIGM